MNILMTFTHFAVSIPRYFMEAFRRNGHTVWTAGMYYGNWIPWTAEGATKEGMLLHERYALHPDVTLTKERVYGWKDIIAMLPGEPDLVLHHPTPTNPLTADIVGRPKQPFALLLTDPHVLEWHYKLVRPDADFVFNMQDYYRHPDDYYIPYAYAPQHHYATSQVAERDVDVACIGLQYPHRRAVMDELAFDGAKTVSQVGLAFDEYRALYNRAKIGFSYSSHHDTIARVFETPRMGAALVCNWTPDLFKFFNDDEVTVFRSGIRGAVDACQRLLADDSERAEKVAKGYKAMEHHTYDNRIKSIEVVAANRLSASFHNRELNEWLQWLKEQRAAQ